MDMNYENWDQNTPLPDWDKELKSIRKHLHRRNCRIILTSVVLVISLLFSTIQFGIPALEKQYWNPDESTYLAEITDLELTMNIYNELFGHGKHFVGVTAQKQGFANYSLEAIFAEFQTRNRLTDVSYRTASLTKGLFNASSNFWIDAAPGMFPRNAARYTEEQLSFHQKNVLNLLQSLPDYIQLHAAVSFSQDLTMEQLQQLTFQYSENSRFLWSILRCGDPSEKSSIPCGVHLTEYQSQRYDPSFWEDTHYPALFTDRLNWTPANIEQHITSMLRFCDDRVQQGKGFLPEQEENSYYQQILSYFLENGIRSYGCYLISSPQVLLDMLENGTIWYIDIIDAQIGF